MSSLKGLNKKDSNSSDYVNEKISKLFYKKEYSTWQIKPWQIKPIHNYKWWDIFYKKYEWQKYKLSFKILHKLYMTD